MGERAAPPWEIAAAPPSPDAGGPKPDLAEQTIAERMRLGKEAERLATERAASLAEPRREALAESQRPIPAAPGPPALPSPPDLQRRPFLASPDNAKPSTVLTTFMTALTTFATAVGGMVAGDAATASAALTGAMRGWMEGDDDRIKLDFKRWETASKDMLQRYDLVRTHYADIMGNRKMNLDQKMNAIGLVAASYDDAIGMNLAQQKNLDVLLKELDNREAKKNQLMVQLQNVWVRHMMADTAGERNEIMRESKDIQAELRRLQMTETERHHREMEDIRRQQGTEKKSAKEDKKHATLAIFETSLNQMDLLAHRLEQKGLLARTGDRLSVEQASLKRWMNPGDPDWARWKQEAASIIGFDRTVLDDKGARAFAAFKNQFEFIDHPTTAEATKAVIAQMRQLLTVAQTGEQPPAQIWRVRDAKNPSRTGRMSWRLGDPIPEGVELVGPE